MSADYICPEVAKLRAALEASERELREAREKSTRQAFRIEELKLALGPFADPERGGAYLRAWEALHQKRAARPPAALMDVDLTDRKWAEKYDAKIDHGKTCWKAPHVGDGHLHAEDDDRLYDVDGVPYCGRCHMALDRRPR